MVKTQRKRVEFDVSVDTVQDIVETQATDRYQQTEPNYNHAQNLNKHGRKLRTNTQTKPDGTKTSFRGVLCHPARKHSGSSYSSKRWLSKNPAVKYVSFLACFKFSRFEHNHKIKYTQISATAHHHKCNCRDLICNWKIHQSKNAANFLHKKIENLRCSKK